MQPYHEYVNHMLRVYFARERLGDVSQIEQQNVEIVEKVLRGRSEEDKENLREIYTGEEAWKMAKSVRKCANNNLRVEKELWNMIRAVSKDIARERGLIE